MNKTVEKMFKELGYYLEYEDKLSIRYKNLAENTVLYFDKYFKKYSVAFANGDFKMITFKLNQAIQKQIEELGW